MAQKTILTENKEYWTGRAAGYSEVNQLELATAQRQKWRECLRGEIARRFPDRAPETLSVLEVGTGPGFFAILPALSLSLSARRLSLSRSLGRIGSSS